VTQMVLALGFVLITDLANNIVCRYFTTCAGKPDWNKLGHLEIHTGICAMIAEDFTRLRPGSSIASFLRLISADFRLYYQFGANNFSANGQFHEKPAERSCPS